MKQGLVECWFCSLTSVFPHRLSIRFSMFVLLMTWPLVAEWSGLADWERRLPGHVSPPQSFAHFCQFRSSLTSDTVISQHLNDRKEKASKWDLLYSYWPLASLLIVDRKWCISEECVIYTPGVGEGHDDLDQVPPGWTAHSNEVDSLYKWDLCSGRKPLSELQKARLKVAHKPNGRLLTVICSHIWFARRH